MRISPIILRVFAGHFLGLLLLMQPEASNAQSLLERLVMPGDLIEGHAKLEKNCENCHESFSQGAQSRLCVSCHKRIDEDVREKQGFHGRSKEVAQRECRHCHTDHIGRDGDIVQLDTETFPHDVTDFALVGAHRSVTCASCHPAAKAFRDAPGSCFGCHEADDPHKTRLGRECEDCHKETTWSETRPFDHSKTDFALKGAHRKLDCKACHIGEIYSDLSVDCVGCHRIQDVHNGTFGKKCESCHAVQTWADARFDHKRDTDFALVGKHEKVACNKCHGATTAASKTPTKCVECHGKDDPHRGKLGTKCDTCHTPKGWRQEVAFDHDITRFPLIGLHVLVPCEGCHLDATYRIEDLACATCHTKDDKHEARLGTSCASCHNPNGWAFWSFDHDTRTKYRLTGQHAGLECEACHTQARNKDVQLATDCASCHARDDVHKGAFGRRCEQCHTTRKFKGAKLRK